MATATKPKATNYIPQAKAQEADNGGKWKQIQAQLATSAFKENQGRQKTSDNGWGQAANPFDMNNVIKDQWNQAIDVNGANQAAQNTTINWIDQLRQMTADQTTTGKNDRLQAQQQGFAYQVAADSHNAQLDRSANKETNPGGEWMNRQDAIGQQQDAARTAADRAASLQNSQIAAQQYAQNQQLQGQRDNNAAASHLAAQQAGAQNVLGTIQANAQLNTAKIGADAGVLSSMFSSFGGGGGGYRYW